MRILRGGPRALFRALNDWADARMAAALSTGPALDARLGERVETAVLARFDADEREEMEAAIERAADAVETYVEDGVDRMMNRFN